jgi:thiol-disulfide isomerase/thioredoxin
MALLAVALSGCSGSAAAPSDSGLEVAGGEVGPGVDNNSGIQATTTHRPLDAPLPGDGVSAEAEPKEKAARGEKVPDEKASEKANEKDDGKDKDDEKDTEHPFPRRVKAPPLDGGKDWLNTAGPLDLKDLRGKWVLLDFWTYCCINCMHVLPELKKLEKAHPNDLVVIGVHSAKFDTEKGTQNIREAILRHEIEHPVVNDADHAIWDAYGISSWPSLRLIDPEGNLVAQHGGEIEFEVLDDFLKKASRHPYYARKGVMDPTPLRFKLETGPATPLRFPGKVLAVEAGGRLFIADSNHNRIVVAKLDGTLIETIGGGEIGRADGDFRTARFNHPQGMVLRGAALYVADTDNHLIRKVDLAAKRVSTIAGTAIQRRSALWPGIKIDDEGIPTLPERFVGKPSEEALASPWDLWIHGESLFIAMAGPHQIWKMTLDEKEIGPYAGNGREDIVDGPLLPGRPFEAGHSSFAQPSGLSSDGEWLYVADSEGSSVRAVPLGPKGEVRTILGTAEQRFGRLFIFGDVDGALDKAKLQHCLGVAYHEGKLYVADTYNSKVKEIDLKAETIKTIAGGGKAGPGGAAALDEPGGLSVAAGKLYVADTNLHRIRVIDLKDANKISTLEIAGLQPPPPAEPSGKPKFPSAKQVELPKAVVKAVDGKLAVTVALELPEGWKINAEAPMAYLVEAEGDAGPIDRAATGKLVRPKERTATFEIAVPLRAATGADKLKVSLIYYYCQSKETGVCKVGSVVWTVPLELADDAKSMILSLPHKIEDAKPADRLPAD